MLPTYCPRAIFQQHGPFQPTAEASAAHCCFCTHDAQEGGQARLAADLSCADDGAVASPAGPRILVVPRDYPDMQEALREAGDSEVSVIQVTGGCDVSWNETVYTAGGHEQAPHPDLEMDDLVDDAPTRRFAMDLLPCLQPQIIHALKNPQMIPLEAAEELELAHASRYSESHLITDQDIVLEGMATMKRPDPHDPEPLVPYPDVLSMPRQRIRVDVRGPPNARVSLSGCAGLYEHGDASCDVLTRVQWERSKSSKSSVNAPVDRRPADACIDDASTAPMAHRRSLARAALQTWGRWRLDKNSFGSLEGLTCGLARDLERTHVEYETFTIICLGGPWEMSHVDVRAGGVSASYFGPRERDEHASRPLLMSPDSFAHASLPGPCSCSGTRKW